MTMKLSGIVMILYFFALGVILMGMGISMSWATIFNAQSKVD